MLPTVNNAQLASLLPTLGFDGLAALWGDYQTRAVAAPSARVATMWARRREAVGNEVHRRGLLIRPSIYGGYNVGRPADFEPIAPGR